MVRAEEESALDDAQVIDTGFAADSNDPQELIGLSFLSFI